MITAALLLWPLVAIVFFRAFSLPTAITATVIGGYLLLPVGQTITGPIVNALKFMPPLHKESIPALSAFVLAMIYAKRDPVARPGWWPKSPVALMLIALFVFGAFGTALTNGDPVFAGNRYLRTLRIYDAFSMIMAFAIMLLPFVLARKFFATPEAHRVLLIVLVIAAVAYSFLALYEVRMSPQLSNKIYGFFPHSWLQHRRPGGWRPVVFLEHGLWLGIFLSCATIAAFGLWRTDRSEQRKYYFMGGVWLLLVLMLSNNFGALIIALALLLMLFLMPYRTQILGAAAVAVILLGYPALRSAGLMPTNTVVSMTETVNPARAASLTFRLNHEEALIARAKERPAFGWGGWGRSSYYSQRGRQISITDGRWIIALGQGGWVRYIAEIGLLTFAILVLALRWRRFELNPVTAVLALVLAANLIDLMPNAGLSPVTWLMAGALAGRLELGRRAAGAPSAEEAGPQDRRAALAYRRPVSGPAYSRPPADSEAGAPSERPPERLPKGPRFTRFEPKTGGRA